MVVKLSQWVEIFPVHAIAECFLLVLILIDGSLRLLLLLLWFGDYLLLRVMHGCTEEFFHGQRRALNEQIVHFNQENSKVVLLLVNLTRASTVTPLFEVVKHNSVT